MNDAINIIIDEDESEDDDGIRVLLFQFSPYVYSITTLFGLPFQICVRRTRSSGSAVPP